MGEEYNTVLAGEGCNTLLTEECNTVLTGEGCITLYLPIGEECTFHLQSGVTLYSQGRGVTLYSQGRGVTLYSQGRGITHFPQPFVLYINLFGVTCVVSKSVINVSFIQLYTFYSSSRNIYYNFTEVMRNIFPIMLS